MDEQPQATTTPKKRKRGRPRKTDPPKIDQAKADQAKADQAKADQAKADQAKADSKPKADPPAKTDQADHVDQVQFVTIRIPIGQLSDGNEYQVSKNNLPRQIRTRPLTRHQAKAIASVRLGMIAEKMDLDSGKADFYKGGRRSVPVETKEQAVSKILELIGDAIERK